MIGLLSYGVYKLVNWKMIFDKEYIESVNKKPEIELPPTLGTTTLNYDQKVWVGSFIKKLKMQSIIIQQLETYEYNDVYFMTTEGLIIKTNTQVDIDSAWNSFVSSYFQDNIQKSNKKLEYIDIRFKNKIFYRFVGDEKLEQKLEQKQVTVATTTIHATTTHSTTTASTTATTTHSTSSATTSVNR